MTTRKIALQNSLNSFKKNKQYLLYGVVAVLGYLAYKKFK